MKPQSGRFNSKAALIIIAHTWNTNPWNKHQSIDTLTPELIRLCWGSLLPDVNVKGSSGLRAAGFHDHHHFKSIRTEKRCQCETFCPHKSCTQNLQYTSQKNPGRLLSGGSVGGRRSGVGGCGWLFRRWLADEAAEASVSELLHIHVAKLVSELQALRCTKPATVILVGTKSRKWQQEVAAASCHRKLRGRK